MIRQNFFYPHIVKEHYKFGSNQIVGTVLREDGDWRNYLPEGEDQRRGIVESSACYIESQQHTIATILEEQFGIVDSNFSARFNALLSHGTQGGGDPLAGADSIRKDGLIPNNLMPFSDEIKSWNDFHSWKNANKDTCLKVGEDFVGEWKLNNDIVFQREEPIGVKYDKLRKGLTFSPIPLSIYGEVDEEGNYIPKPSGVDDSHMVECTFMDSNNRIYIRDTYKPYDKILPAGYNPDFAMRWSVGRAEQKKSLLDILRGIWRWFIKEKSILTEFRKGISLHYERLF